MWSPEVKHKHDTAVGSLLLPAAFFLFALRTERVMLK